MCVRQRCLATEPHAVVDSTIVFLQMLADSLVSIIGEGKSA